jgi:ATPase family AAA domain-containing protein 3A/B
MAKPYAVSLLSAMAAATGLSHNHSFSDVSATSSDEPESPPPPPKFRNNNPRTEAAGFDPEPLIKGAKMLNDIANSPHGKNVSFLSLSHFFHSYPFALFCYYILTYLVFVFKVFENIKKREDEKKSEMDEKTAEFNQMKALHEAVSLS